MRAKSLFILLSILLLCLFVVDLMVGSVAIPLQEIWAALTGGECAESTRKIVCEIRLIKAATALLAGLALTISGLQMQTLFRNPLAGPYVLGISSGASFGVAIFILGVPLLGLQPDDTWTTLGRAGAAWLGGISVLGIIATLSHRIRDIMVILILGMMFSSGISSLVQILQYLSNEEALKSYVIWTMGSLGEITGSQLLWLFPPILLGLLFAIATIKPLNLLLLGEQYARTMGVDLRRSRTLIFLSTTLLAGSITAFCGPISFIGLAIPHVARSLFREADHRILLSGTALTGCCVMLFCDIVSKYWTLPINTITALLGIPVVVWIVMRNR